MYRMIKFFPKATPLIMPKSLAQTKSTRFFFPHNNSPDHLNIEIKNIAKNWEKLTDTERKKYLLRFQKITHKNFFGINLDKLTDEQLKRFRLQIHQMLHPDHCTVIYEEEAQRIYGLARTLLEEQINKRTNPYSKDNTNTEETQNTYEVQSKYTINFKQFLTVQIPLLFAMYAYKFFHENRKNSIRTDIPANNQDISPNNSVDDLVLDTVRIK
ncbi:MAG: hypothetical protein QM652_04040 [Legionella sp.]|uniref:hypothetical protein n=1 Tax=Legionella sp. TaxID=459 RepID=UPI0039E55C4F